MFYRSNQKKLMAEALSSSENICWTFYWITFPLDKIRRRRQRMSSCVYVLCFTRMICQKKTKSPRNIVSKRASTTRRQSRSEQRERQRERRLPSEFFCFRCLHVLLELVNHTGSLSYHNILTEGWYLLKLNLQPKPLGCVL